MKIHEILITFHRPLLIVLAIVLIKLLINLSKYFRCKNHLSLYFDWSDMAQITVSMFHQAIGTFKARAKESLNPISWIEFIITLPKAVLTYLGVKPEHVAIKILQLIYWMAGLTTTAVYGFFKPNLVTLIRGMFGKP